MTDLPDWVLWVFGGGVGVIGLLVGGLLGALAELRKVKTVCWESWQLTGKAQARAAELRKERDAALEKLGVLKAQRGEVLEAAISAAKLAQLDALRPQEMPPRSPHGPDAENHADIPTAGR